MQDKVQKYCGGKLVPIPEDLGVAIKELKARLNFTWDNIADRIPADVNGHKPHGTSIYGVANGYGRRATTGIIDALIAMTNIKPVTVPTHAVVPIKVDAYLETVTPIETSATSSTRNQAEDCILEAVCAMNTRDVLFIAKIARHIMARV